MKELHIALLQEQVEVEAFYHHLIESDEKYQDILKWKKGIYPSSKDIQNYIERKELYILKEEDILAAFVLTSKQSPAYQKIPWKNQGEARIIHLLAIHPKCQGQGLATRMLDCIVDICQQHHITSLRLDAIASNLPAQNLYEKYGFEKRGIMQEYYESTGTTDFIFYEYTIG